MYYDETAKSYNELYKKEQLNKLKVISSILKVDMMDRLLDIGCGTGISTNYFKCETYGIDTSLNMLKEGSGNLINARAENLPFKDKIFDIIIAVTSFHNFSDFNRAITEIRRVGKPGCKLVITVMKKSRFFKKIKEQLLRNFNLKQLGEAKDAIFYCSI